jgi:hypothetical protein
VTGIEAFSVLGAASCAAPGVGLGTGVPAISDEEAAQDAREDVAVAVGRLGGCFGWAHLRW